MQATDFRGLAMAGNGAMALVDQMVFPDTMDRVTDMLANNYRAWLSDGTRSLL